MSIYKYVCVYEIFYIMANLRISFRDMFMDLNLVFCNTINLT